MKTLFELQNTSFIRKTADREIRVLDAVDLTIPAAPFLVVMGPSGSGKSSLLRLLNRLESFTAGDILFEGRSLTQWPVTALRRKVGMLFQMPCLPEKSVRDNLTYGPHLTGQKISNDRLKLLLEEVDLEPGMLERDAREFSVGQQQRLCLARVLANAPEVLLLDEPTASLDASTTLTIEATIRKIADAGLVHVIWVTHSSDQARRFKAPTVVLEGGKITCAT